MLAEEWSACKLQTKGVAITIYDPTLTDDEWREQNFSDDEIAAAFQGQRLGKQGAKALIDYAQRYGKEGVQECAIMLGQSAYLKVEEALAKLPDPDQPRRRRRRTR